MAACLIPAGIVLGYDVGCTCVCAAGPLPDVTPGLAGYRAAGIGPAAAPRSVAGGPFPAPFP